MFCRNCGKEIDDKAVICPGCGVPTSETGKKKKKKKHPILGAIIVIFGILLIAVAVSGGGEDAEKAEPTKSSTASTTVETEPPKTEPPKTEYSVGDKVELNDIVVTLVNVTESNGSTYNKPADGNVFILLEFTIENNSKKDISVSSIMSFESYVDDYTANMSFSAQLETDKNQLDGTVAAGKKMNGVIGYEVGKDFKEFEIRFTPDFWAGKDIVFTYKK